MKLATRRLIDASATLPPADRALLNLWTQRGLDDAAMARMTRVDPATIAHRRDRIVTGLSSELGLPPQDVALALSAIAQSAAESVALRAGSGAAAPAEKPASGGGPAAPGSGVILAPEPQAEIEPRGDHSESHVEPQPDASRRDRGRRRLLWVAAPLFAAALIAIVALTVTSQDGGHSATTKTGATSSSAVAAIPARSPGTLRPLPGGVAGATGAVTLAPGPARTKRLLVHALGLPPAGGGHYEVWLYNSIIDSVALGRLSPQGNGSFALPAGAARFASVDISRQPPGATEPSGLSRLRTANPLRTRPR